MEHCNDKITRRFLLKEEYNPDILEYLNILEGNLRLIRTMNKADESRLNTAKNIIREVKTRVRKLEERVRILEEEKTLEENKFSKNEQ